MTSLHILQKTVSVGKDKTNDFGGYSYRTAEGILAAIKAHMPEGAWIKVSDTLQEVAGHIFVTSTASLYLPDDGIHAAEGHAMHPITKKGMDPSQITGAASSYARKYALSGLMALDDGTADPDGGKEPYDPFDAGTERDRIKHAIEGARTLPGLQKTWTDNIEVLGKIRSEKPPMLAELTKAKDERRAALSPPDPAKQAPDE